MDEVTRAYCREQATKLTEGYIYCDLILTPGGAVALQELVAQLRAGGQSQVLDRVFGDILEEIERAR